MSTPLSISHSRSGMIRECPRRYYFHYYQCRDGWKHDAPADSRDAYRLKQLTSVPEAIGTVIHELAQESVEAIRRRLPLPTPEEMIPRSSDHLNGIWIASKDVTGFRRDPKNHPMYMEQYYDRTSNERLAIYSARMKSSLRNLPDWPGWADVAACPPEDILTFDALNPVEYEGMLLYAAPDLVYRTPEGCWTIVDFKTGREPSVPELEEHRRQVQLYYLFLIVCGIITTADVVFGRLAYLSVPDDVVFTLAGTDLEEAERRVRGEWWQMRQLLVEMDASRNEALPREHFPQTGVQKRCGGCKFQEICLAQTNGAVRPGPF
jgi:hypothetical protein